MSKDLNLNIIVRQNHRHYCPVCKKEWGCEEIQCDVSDPPTLLICGDCMYELTGEKTLKKMEEEHGTENH